MPRKWNDLGRTQIAILHMIIRVPKTEEQILNRLKYRLVGVSIEKLVERGMMVLKDGKYHATAHGKAVVLPPAQYQKWREMWGMA